MAYKKFLITASILSSVNQAAWSMNGPQDPLAAETTINISYDDIIYVNRSGIAQVTLATNGDILYSSNLDGSSLGTPGNVLITGQKNADVQVVCPSSITLNDNIQIVDIEFTRGLSSGTNANNGTACSQQGNIVRITGNPKRDTLLVAGTLIVSDLSQLTPGSDSITVSIPFSFSYQ